MSKRVGGFPSFAQYMESCLYDPCFGYYGSGKASFGVRPGMHFFTYPQLMAPVFGWMLAEKARSLFRELLSAGRLPAPRRFSIVELGAGNGDLARDTMDYIRAHAREPRWLGIAARVRYVACDQSAALRRRQRRSLAAHIRAGTAEVRDMNALELRWNGPFQGLIVANELIDAFPCERIRITGPTAMARVFVVPLIKSAHARRMSLTEHCREVPAGVAAHRGETALDAEGLRRCLRADGAGALRFAELAEPLEERWGTVPRALEDYLHSLAPLIRDLEHCRHLPVDVHWAPGLAAFIERLSDLLTGQGRRGAALLLDYGGTSRHVLDPRAMSGHFRVYGPDPSRSHENLAYEHPGQYDMTCDVDFTEVARLSRCRGLKVAFFGHQEAMEAPPIDLCSPEVQRCLVQRRMREGDVETAEAEAYAGRLARRFREAAGFRLMALASPALGCDFFPRSDPVDGEGLWTVPETYDPAIAAQAFGDASIPADLAVHLKPCGDPVADLSDRRSYSRRHDVWPLLLRKGWLVPSVCDGRV